MKVTNAPEPDTRYAMLLKTYQAARMADPYSPTAPTLIARRFEREPPDPRGARAGDARGGALLAARAARRGAHREAARPPARAVRRLVQRLPAARQLHRGPARRHRHARSYPTAEAYKEDIPNLLVKLGFTKERADYLAANIVVDPARGSGHAAGAAAARRQGAPAHARREGRDELQGLQHRGPRDGPQRRADVLAERHRLDAAAGRPQHRVHRGAGVRLPGARPRAARPRRSPTRRATRCATLNDFWATYEIAGVALVDMAVWHWMYDHPNATPAQLKAATLQICKDVWNKYYAPVFKKKDVVLRSASTRTWSTPSSTCPTTRSAT